MSTCSTTGLILSSLQDEDEDVGKMSRPPKGWQLQALAAETAGGP